MHKLKVSAEITLHNGDKIKITNHVSSRQAFVKDLHSHFESVKSIKLTK